MSFKTKAARIAFEALVGGALSRIGEHLGDVIGQKLARKVDPSYKPSMPAGDDEGEE